MIVVDASALIEYLLGTQGAEPIGAIVADPEADLHVPALCDVEVAAALRGLLLGGTMTVQRAGEALEDYLDLPLTRHGHTRHLPRMLELRENMSAYDATYVALAERLGALLLTTDHRLARAVSGHTAVELAG